MHRWNDAGAQKSRPSQCGEASRPHCHYGTEGHDAEERNGEDDDEVPLQLRLVLGRKTQQEDDERTLRNNEAYTGEIEKNILQGNNESDVARGQGFRQLTAEAVIGVKRDEAIVREEKCLETARSASGSQRRRVMELTTYKSGIVKVVLEGIELENLDSGEQAKDDEDSGHEEECPEDCDDPDIPQGYGEIC